MISLSHVIKPRLDRYLFISDLQIPFHHPQALRFCLDIKNEYAIPDQNIYCVGDELDLYFGGLWKKSIEANHTAASELAASLDELKRWYEVFPKMKLATSNHGLRWLRKAAEADIPSQLIIPYRTMIEAPDSWKWADSWDIDCKYPVRMIHGMGYSGQNGHRNAVIDHRRNMIIGHIHSHAGISFVDTGDGMRWGMNVGCLIDNVSGSYAFQYGKYHRHKPVISCGVVLDSGKTPLVIPMGD
jgi:hypothetical protein